MKHRYATTGMKWLILCAVLGASFCGIESTSDLQAASVSGPKTVKVSIEKVVVGKAAKYLGVGIHNFDPVASNQLIYLKALGVNSVRVFDDFGRTSRSTPFQSFEGEGKWGTDFNSKPVTNGESFKNAVATLSSDPTGASWSNPILWDKATSALNLQSKYSSLTRANLLTGEGISTHIQLSRPDGFVDFSSYSMSDHDYWEERWELFKYFYAYGRLAMERGVTMFELINEPELIGRKLKWDDNYTTRWTADYIQVVGYAIQQAAIDLGAKNPDAAKKVMVIGPSNSAKINPDLNVDVGPRTLSRIFDDINIKLGRNNPTPNWNNVNGFSIHRYNGTKEHFSKITDDLIQFASDNNVKLPIFMTEYNTHFSLEFGKLEATPDSPEEASRLAAESLGMIDRVEGQYAFNFAAYRTSKVLLNNGMHSFSDSPNASNIGGRMRQAAVYSLLANNFANKDLYRTTLTGDTTLIYGISTADPVRWATYLVNDDSKEANVTIDLASLGLNEENFVSISEVSARSRGETKSLIKIGSKHSIPYHMPSHSVILVTCVRGPNPRNHHTTYATSTAQVKAGSESSENIPPQAKIHVETSAAGDNSHTEAMLLKFPAPNSAAGPDAQKKNLPVLSNLKLTIDTSGKKESILHVYGFADTAWHENTVTWDNSGFLKPLPEAIVVDRIANNFVNYQNPNHPTFLGEIVVPPNSKKYAALLNVSDFVRSHLPQGMTFLVVREFRVDPISDPGIKTLPGDILGDSRVTFDGRLAPAESDQPALLMESLD